MSNDKFLVTCVFVCCRCHTSELDNLSPPSLVFCNFFFLSSWHLGVVLHIGRQQTLILTTQSPEEQQKRLINRLRDYHSASVVAREQTEISLNICTSSAYTLMHYLTFSWSVILVPSLSPFLVACHHIKIKYPKNLHEKYVVVRGRSIKRNVISLSGLCCCLLSSLLLWTSGKMSKEKSFSLSCWVPKDEEFQRNRKRQQIWLFSLWCCSPPSTIVVVKNDVLSIWQTFFEYTNKFAHPNLSTFSLSCNCAACARKWKWRIYDRKTLIICRDDVLVSLVVGGWESTCNCSARNSTNPSHLFTFRLQASHPCDLFFFCVWSVQPSTSSLNPLSWASLVVASNRAPRCSCSWTQYEL